MTTRQPPSLSPASADESARVRIARNWSFAPGVTFLNHGSCGAPPGEAAPLQDALWRRRQIEVPILEWQDQRLVRVTCQMYTSPSDVERLSHALRSLLDVPGFRCSA